MLKEAEKKSYIFLIKVEKNNGLKVGEIICNTLFASTFAQDWLKTWTDMFTLVRHKYRSLSVPNSIY